MVALEFRFFSKILGEMTGLVLETICPALLDVGAVHIPDTKFKVGVPIRGGLVPCQQGAYLLEQVILGGRPFPMTDDRQRVDLDAVVFVFLRLVQIVIGDEEGGVSALLLEEATDCTDLLLVALHGGDPLPVLVPGSCGEHQRPPLASREHHLQRCSQRYEDRISP